MIKYIHRKAYIVTLPIVLVISYYLYDFKFSSYELERFLTMFCIIMILGGITVASLIKTERMCLIADLCLLLEYAKKDLYDLDNYSSNWFLIEIAIKNFNNVVLSTDDLEKNIESSAVHLATCFNISKGEAQHLFFPCCQIEELNPQDSFFVYDHSSTNDKILLRNIFISNLESFIELQKNN